MTEEPYRWLEAVANRREYISTQLRGGSPAFAVSLAEGILLLGVGTGLSKVFELFDRQALAGLGHPADLERVRQSLIDAAHLEAFTRSPVDVSLRRLVSFGLGPQLKAAFEQIFSPPCLVRLVLAEVGVDPAHDMLATVDFDGTFAFQEGGVALVAEPAAVTDPARQWLAARLSPRTSLAEATCLLLEAWHHLTSGRDLPDVPGDATALAALPDQRLLEAALLRRDATRPARFVPLSCDHIGLPALPAHGSAPAA